MKMTLVIKSIEDGVSFDLQTILKKSTTNLYFDRESDYFGLTKSEKTRVLNHGKFRQNDGRKLIKCRKKLELCKSNSVAYQN